MPRRAALCFKVGCWILVLTFVAHMGAHLSGPPEPTDETQRQLLDLMRDYRMPIGGVERSMLELMIGYSLSFAMLSLFAGLTGLVVIRSAPPETTRRMAVLLAGLTGILLGISVRYFIPPPMICFGAAMLCFAAALALGRGPADA